MLSDTDRVDTRMSSFVDGDGEGVERFRRKLQHHGAMAFVRFQAEILVPLSVAFAGHAQNSVFLLDAVKFAIAFGIANVDLPVRGGAYFHLPVAQVKLNLRDLRRDPPA